MLGCWSSGFSPTPSTGTGLTVEKGLTPPAKSIRPVKKAAIPAITAVAYGTISRSLPRVAKSAAEAAIERTQAQSRSEPSWLDHIAASL